MLTQTAIRSDAFRRSVPSPHASLPKASQKPDAAAARTTFAQMMQLMGAVISYPRNTEIFGENEPAEYLYKVVGGAVRTYKVTSDGRRQIGGFYLPGDIFGLEFGNEHSLSAEAITDAKVLVIRQSAVSSLAERDPAVAQELLALTGCELHRVQERILLLVQSAHERVANFLLEMAKRSPTGNAVELPMPRQDIADYLGLTIETISRTLTSLESAAAIEVPTSRQIVLRNRSALSRMNA